MVAVDDGSTDCFARDPGGTRGEYPGRVRVIQHKRNAGKGAAIRTGFAARARRIRHHPGRRPRIRSRASTPKLLNRCWTDKADVVYGSRFLISGERRVLYFWHSLANRLLTTLCNMAADLNLTDMETCYKAFRTVAGAQHSDPQRPLRHRARITIKFAKRQASHLRNARSAITAAPTKKARRSAPRMRCSAIWVILRCGLTPTSTWIAARTFWTRCPARRGSIAGWRTRSGPIWASACWRLGAGIGNMTQHLSRGRRSCTWRPTSMPSTWAGCACASSIRPNLRSPAVRPDRAGRLRRFARQHGYGGLPERAGARGERLAGLAQYP